MPQSVACRQLNQLTQTAQSGGYWLITGVLNEPLDEVYAFYSLQESHNPTQGEQACSDLSVTTINLSLFDYSSSTLKLLSKQPLNEATIDLGNATLQIHPSSALKFDPHQTTLLLASDLGIGPLFYVAKQIKKNDLKHLALLHASHGFPFAVKPAQIMLQDFPFEAIGGCSLLEDWKIANRLASDLGLPGCLDGSISDLFTPWLEAENQRQTENPLNWQIISFSVKDPSTDLKTLIGSYAWIDYQAVSADT